MRPSGAPALGVGDIHAVESILRLWLEDPDLTIFCGAWSNGAIMELLPHGKASLTGQRYSGQFAGLRDLLLDDGGHHVHLDLARLNRVRYIVAPSVCYGFRPSFELRLAAESADPMREFGLGLALRHPYDRETLREAAAKRYFNRVMAHLQAYPAVTSLAIRRRGAYADERSADWSAIERVLSSDPDLQPLRDYLPSGGTG